MIKLYDKGAYLLNGSEIIDETDFEKVTGKIRNPNKEEAKKGTIAYGILEAHNKSDDLEDLRIKFDALTSHDITFVGIIQTARASRLEKFPIPYVLTNCHNSLAAVGGTINEDDHIFGLTAAKKYGGIYVPPHMAVIHQYMREEMAGCGKMILGSDSHTRYGALGTMAIGEGGGELVKQILGDTYDIKYPEVVGIYLDNKPIPGVGPQDIALAIIGKVFKNGYVKNKVMEFVGPGVSNLKTDYRNGIDVMTTETTCLTSIWRTDEDTKKFLRVHKREGDYKELNPEDLAYYDGMVYVDLSEIKPMIALPFHPSNTYTIDELNENLEDILRSVEEEARRITNNPNIDYDLLSKIRDNKLHVEQAIIAGCAGGTYSNIMAAANILKGASTGSGEFSLSVYPSSQPIFMELIKNGAMNEIMASGAAVKTAFCGPCFGAGDTPANNALSIRHTTRNFPNREGSKPIQGQMSGVALMDARSIAATARNKGILTSAEEFATDYEVPEYHYDDSAYRSKVYKGFKNEDKDEELILGPNIKDWPEMSELTDNILLKVCSKIMDPVTTTDELIPSGETSSYRSNPLGLAEFTLSRRDPEYVGRSKEVRELEVARKDKSLEVNGELAKVFDKISNKFGDIKPEETEIGSMIYAIKPGDGSAREQAASCQRVLGGLANICEEYATKRYRSNVINWGMIPFQMKESPDFEVGDYIFVPNIRQALNGDLNDIKAYVVGDDLKEISLYISPLTDLEREIIKEGCLINFKRKNK
ncbi:hydratase [Peptoniphilus harei]|uniref:hydratase n=1 Tax=Peptoniphilus TaxID=162289 RepID=UPI00255003F7|nr:hydratase [Peptoniphilus harei]MDK7354250.1 hydratase [Peptoniphilus harei]MDK7370122.1 hydratase [Peptoniphilus harei]MDK7376844.1 hydratase [Peptoniphilus harei]MDK7678688.1 hydratase [Peptoniphilus harei]